MAATSNPSVLSIPGAIPPVSNLSAAAINALHSEIAVLDARGNIVGVNRAWRDLSRQNQGDPLGYVGQNYVEVCERAAQADAQVQEVVTGLRKVLRGDLTSYEFEYRCDRPDRIRWFKMVVSPMPAQHGGAVVIHEDVSDRRAAADATAHQHELLLTVLQTTDSAIIVYDGQGVTRLVNRKTVELMGLPETALVGSDCTDPVWKVRDPQGREIAPEDRPVRQVLRHGKPLRNQRISIMPEGRPRRQLSVNLSPVLDAHGEVELVIITVEDITEQIEAKVALERRLEIEALVSEISRLFNRSTSRELEGAVHEAIGLLGQFLKVDRVSIYLFDEVQRLMTLTHEWCQPGVSSRGHTMQRRAMGEFRWAPEKLRQPDGLQVDDVEQLPREAHNEQLHWRATQVRAMLALPVQVNERMVGALGLDMATQPRNWQDEERAILTSLARVLGQALERKRIEELAWTERNLNAAILDSAGTLVCVLDTDLRIIRFNRACERITGYRFSEVKGKQFDELLLAAEERQSVLHVMSEAAGGKFPNTNENDWLSRDGERRRIRWYNNAIFGEQGKVAYVVCVGVEVTGQRRAEAALRERLDVENLLTGINTRFNRLPPAELSHGIEQALAELGRFVNADHACVLLHAPRRRALSMQYEWCRPGGSRPIQAHCQHLPIPEGDFLLTKLRTKQPWVVRDILDQEGAVHPIAPMFRRLGANGAVLAPMVQGDKVLGCVCVSFANAQASAACDQLMLNAAAMAVAYALERAEVDAALRASEQRQRALLGGIPDPIYRISREGEVLDVEAEPHPGMAMLPEAMIGRSIAHVLRDDAGQMIKAAIPEALTSNYHVALTYRIESDAGPLHFETRLLATGPNEVMAIERDITEQRRAQEEARMRRHELLQVSRLATVGEMAAGLAHEMNQPLAAIANYARGSLRLLDQQPVDTTRLLMPLEQIAQQAERAGRIIQNIRRFVARHELKRAHVDINQVVRRALDFVQSDVDSHGVGLDANLMPQLPELLLDSVLIEQVVVNLVLNAMDAMRESASTSVQQIEVSTRQDEQRVYVTVADTGAGITAADLAHVFDPFFTTKAEGLGLGLAISKSIVEGHDGRIWVESVHGTGAAFTFAIPLPESLQPDVETGDESPRNVVTT